MWLYPIKMSRRDKNEYQKYEEHKGEASNHNM